MVFLSEMKLSKTQENFCAHLRAWVERNYGARGGISDLAKRLKVSQSHLSNVLAGRRGGNEIWRRWVAKELGLDYETMVGGKLEVAENFEPYLIKSMIYIPVFNGKADEPSSFTDEGYPVGMSSEYVSIPRKGADEHTFGIKIYGRSMSPYLNPGDIVIVVPGAPLVNGKLCFAAWPDDDGRKLVKRYYRYGDTIVLKSDNPDSKYSEITLAAENSKSIRMYRVTKSIRGE